MPTQTYTTAEIDAAFAAVDARLKALEAGTPPVDPPPLTESPNFTSIVQGGTIVHGGHRWTIGTDAKVYVDEAVDGLTANVVRLMKEDPFIYQRNTADLWWRKTVPTVAWEASAAPPHWTPPIPPVDPPGTTTAIRFNKGSLRPVVTAGANAITVDLTKTTGAWWNKAVSGCAAQGLDNVTWGGQYRMLLDPAFQSACADLGFRFVRINGLGLIKDAFGPAANASAPVWTWIDNIIAGFRKTFPLAQFCLSMSGNGDFNYADVTLRTNYASAARQILQRMQDRGLTVDFVGAINEPDGGGTPPKVLPANAAATMAAVRNAVLPVLAPGVKFAGPFTSYGRTEFATPFAVAGADMIAFHSYNHPNQPQNPPNPTDDKIWTDATRFGDVCVAMQAAARAGAARDYLIALTEYGLDWTPGANNDPRQQTYKGAIFTSLLLMSGVYGGLAAGTIWRAENWDATYGPFQTGKLVPNSNGVLLRALNRVMGGDLVPLTITSSGTQKLLGLGTTTASDIGLILTNFDSVSNWVGPISLSGRTSAANLTRLDITSANPGGVTSSISSASLGAISLPAQSIAVLSGLR